MNAELVSQVLDLDSWTEAAGVGSVDAIVCPHAGCGRGHSLPGSVIFGRQEFHVCAFCRLPFYAKAIASPLGPAWFTEAISEAQLEEFSREVSTRR